MEVVEDLQWDLGSSFAQWMFQGEVVRREYAKRIGSASVLPDGSGVCLIEPWSHRPNNGLIMNADGSERCRIAIPTTEQHLVFNHAYNVRGKLTAISGTPVFEYASEIDEQTGAVLRTYSLDERLISAEGFRLRGLANR